MLILQGCFPSILLKNNSQPLANNQHKWDLTAISYEAQIKECPSSNNGYKDIAYKSDDGYRCFEQPIVEPLDSEEELYAYALGWRTGLMEFPWDNGNLDFGMDLELATGPIGYYYEFRLGLPSTIKEWKHSTTIGMSPGFWFGNHWFLGYGTAYQWEEAVTLYGNLRGAYLGASLNSFDELDYKEVLPSSNHWMLQAGLGIEFNVLDEFQFNIGASWDTPSLVQLDSYLSQENATINKSSLRLQATMSLTFKVGKTPKKEGSN